MRLKAVPRSEIPVYGARTSRLYSRSGAGLVVRGGEKFESVLQKVELQQRFFVSGKTVLELERNPTLTLDIREKRFEIEGWGLTLPYEAKGQIAREMVRRFLILFDKAEKMDLTEEEEVQWEGIVKQVNYRRFCIDRAPDRYVEGNVVERGDAGCQIEWVDGEKEWVKGELAAELAVLNEGERFGAYAKFGLGNRLLTLRNVRILAPLDESMADQMWNEWPTNRS